MIWLLRFYARLFNGWPTSSGLLVSRRRNTAIYGPLCPLSSLAFEKMGDARALRDSSSFDERKSSNRTNEISIERNENCLSIFDQIRIQSKFNQIIRYSSFILEFKKETHWKFEILRATIRSSFEYFQSSFSFYKSQPPIKKIYFDPRLMNSLGHESMFESSSNLASPPPNNRYIHAQLARLILYWYNLGTSWCTE